MRLAHHHVVCPSRRHLQEMQCGVVGDRILFMGYLALLKKHKRDLDRSKALWTGTTPVPKLAYHRNFGEFCFQVSLPSPVPPSLPLPSTLLFSQSSLLPRAHWVNVAATLVTLVWAVLALSAQCTFHPVSGFVEGDWNAITILSPCQLGPTAAKQGLLVRASKWPARIASSWSVVLSLYALCTRPCGYCCRKQ